MLKVWSTLGISCGNPEDDTCLFTYDAQIRRGHAMDMVGTRILHIKGEVPHMIRHNTLPILKYLCIIAFHGFLGLYARFAKEPGKAEHQREREAKHTHLQSYIIMIVSQMSRERCFGHQIISNKDFSIKFYW